MKKPKIEETKSNIPIIRDVIVAVGGGSGKILDESAKRLLSAGKDKGVETVLIACNTDNRELSRLNDEIIKIGIGTKTTKGWGAGSRPEIGALAMQESMEEVLDAIGNYNRITIILALGGGTGSGAGPELVARIAQEINSPAKDEDSEQVKEIEDKIPQVFALMPFAMEGPDKMKRARDAMEKLEGQNVLLIRTENDKFFSATSANPTPIAKLYAIANIPVSQAIARMNVDINYGLSLQNLDWRDLLTIMRIPLDSDNVPRESYVGVGYASGMDRTEKALEEAVKSILFDSQVKDAKGVAFTVRAAGFNDKDLMAIHQFIATLSEDAKVIFGYGDELIELEFESKKYQAVACVIAVGCQVNSVRLTVQDQVVVPLASDVVKPSVVVEKKKPALPPPTPLTIPAAVEANGIPKPPKPSPEVLKAESAVASTKLATVLPVLGEDDIPEVPADDVLSENEKETAPVYVSPRTPLAPNGPDLKFLEENSLRIAEELRRNKAVSGEELLEKMVNSGNNNSTVDH